MDAIQKWLAKQERGIILYQDIRSARMLSFRTEKNLEYGDFTFHTDINPNERSIIFDGTSHEILRESYPAPVEELLINFARNTDRRFKEFLFPLVRARLQVEPIPRRARSVRVEYNKNPVMVVQDLRDISVIFKTTNNGYPADLSLSRFHMSIDHSGKASVAPSSNPLKISGSFGTSMMPKDDPRPGSVLSAGAIASFSNVPTAFPLNSPKGALYPITQSRLTSSNAFKKPRNSGQFFKNVPFLSAGAVASSSNLPTTLGLVPFPSNSLKDVPRFQPGVVSAASQVSTTLTLQHNPHNVMPASPAASDGLSLRLGLGRNP